MGKKKSKAKKKSYQHQQAAQAKNQSKHQAKQQAKSQVQKPSQPQTKPAQAKPAAFGYTLQPIPCNISAEEMHLAQAELFKQSNNISTRTWIILAIITAIGVGGVAYFQGSATIFFWLLLVGVALFFVFKFVALPWYMKREMAKQPIPDELGGIKLGLQQHGLVMAMPNSMAMEQMQQRMGGGKQGKSMMTMMQGRQMGGDIPWSAMTEWKETKNFYVVMFDLKGQQGSQIIPKRMRADNFPIDNLVKHLKEHVPQT